MIESIDNGMMVLKPAVKVDDQAKHIRVKVDTEIPKPAEYLYNPHLADKINASRQSIKEEMGLLREANLSARARQVGGGLSDEESAVSLSLDVLQRSLARIESLLYQFASVAAADPDSLEALQRKLAEELRGFKRIFEGVELKEIVPPDIDMNRIDVTSKIKPEKLDSLSAASAREAVSAAKDAVGPLLARAGEKKASQSLTEAVLSTTDQNLAAAESALYPEEITARAKEASLSMRDRMPEVFGAQAHLQPDQVFRLISSG
jgi:hypothetical protein